MTTRSGRSLSQVSEYFHVAVEARRATGYVFADLRIAGLDGLFSHAL
jgi:hypothetical protein